MLAACRSCVSDVRRVGTLFGLHSAPGLFINLEAFPLHKRAHSTRTESVLKIPTTDDWEEFVAQCRKHGQDAEQAEGSSTQLHGASEQPSVNTEQISTQQELFSLPSPPAESAGGALQSSSSSAANELSIQTHVQRAPAGFSAPVFPGEAHIQNLSAGRSEYSLEEWKPYSQMVRLVMQRYADKFKHKTRLSPTHRLFMTRLQENRGWLQAYSHIPMVYFSNPRFPSAFVRYILRLDFDSHALPDFHLNTLPNGTSFSSLYTKARRRYLLMQHARHRMRPKSLRTWSVDANMRIHSLEHLASDHFLAAQEVCRKIQTETENPAYITGGAVRDMLLGIQAKDFDIAAGVGTDTLLKMFPGSRQMRNVVGTVEVIEGGYKVEVTPLRNFGPATAEWFWALNRARDAAGRDFSANSLAVDPVRMMLYDCNGGVRALRQFRLTSASMPIASLTSDPVRCVRMLRIAAGYGMSVDRTLGLTAADLSAGRLLTPPSNLLLNNPNQPRSQRAVPVHLASQEALEEQWQHQGASSAFPAVSKDPSGGRDPRDPPMADMSHLSPNVVGVSSQTLQLRREMVLESFQGSPKPLANEFAKLVVQDRSVPGSLADAIQLAVSMGMLDAKLGMPILEVAGNQDDRKMLGGMPGSREMVPTGWQFAVPRLARMHPHLSPDQKLMTLLLGRTRAGVATVLPHTWLLFSPNSATRRFEMFRTTLLFHRMQYSPEFAEFTKPLELKTMELSQDVPMRPGDTFGSHEQPHAMAAMDAIRSVLQHTGGDFTTLLSLEKYFQESSSRLKVDLSVFFRSVRRGVGQNIFNMAGGGHPMGNLLKAPFTPNPLKASTADQQRMQFGKWASKWPLVVPDETPWTHKAAARMTPVRAQSSARHRVPLRDTLAISDVPEQVIVGSKDVQASFFRMLLLRAWLGCRKAAVARTQSLISRTLNIQRASMGPKHFEGTKSNRKDNDHDSFGVKPGAFSAATAASTHGTGQPDSTTSVSSFSAMERAATDAIGSACVGDLPSGSCVVSDSGLADASFESVAASHDEGDSVETNSGDAPQAHAPGGHDIQGVQGSSNPVTTEAVSGSAVPKGSVAFGAAVSSSNRTGPSRSISGSAACAHDADVATGGAQDSETVESRKSDRSDASKSIHTDVWDDDAWRTKSPRKDESFQRAERFRQHRHMDTYYSWSGRERMNEAGSELPARVPRVLRQPSKTEKYVPLGVKLQRKNAPSPHVDLLEAAFPSGSGKFPMVAKDWKGWDRLRHPPSHEAADERTRWGIPESQVRQLLFQGDELMLETLANLLDAPAARASFRGWVQEIADESVNERTARQRIRRWVLHNAADILAPFESVYHWTLPEPSSAPLDLGKLRMDERRFTLDVALGLMQARLWDEPHLMRSIADARSACDEMVPLHTALCVALTQSHLFDDEGTLMPFVFSAELATIAHARHRFGPSNFSAPHFPHCRLGDDFRSDVSSYTSSANHKGTAGGEAQPDEILGGLLERMSAGYGGVPDEVVREAWMRAAPWMHVSIPDWWAFKVWDRDLWIRTETEPSAYNDKFRPAEQLYAACTEPRSDVDFVVRRNKQEASARQREAELAQKATENEHKKHAQLLERQEKLFSDPEPSEENENSFQKMEGPEGSKLDAEDQSSTDKGNNNTSGVLESDTYEEGEDLWASFSEPGGAERNAWMVEEGERSQMPHAMHDRHATRDDTVAEEDDTMSWEDLDGCHGVEEDRNMRSRSNVKQ